MALSLRVLNNRKKYHWLASMLWSTWTWWRKNSETCSPVMVCILCLISKFSTSSSKFCFFSSIGVSTSTAESARGRCSTRRPREPRCISRLWALGSWRGSRRTCRRRSGRRWNRYRSNSIVNLWSSRGRGTTTWPTMRGLQGRVCRGSRKNTWRSWKRWLSTRTVIIRLSIRCRESSWMWGRRRNSCFKSASWTEPRHWKGKGMKWRQLRGKRLRLVHFKPGLRRKRRG